MRKTLLILSILFVTLVSTACVNRFAVQELNNKAQEMIKSGNVEGAISRLESSIDLDETVFETHYNLAVAYIQAKKYDKALKSLEKVNELKPEFADAYYSTAVIYDDMATAVIEGEKDSDSVEDAKVDEPSDNSQKQKDLTEADKTKICEYTADAIDNYNKYLSKKADAADKDKVNSKIEELNKQLQTYTNVKDSEQKAE